MGNEERLIKDARREVARNIRHAVDNMETVIQSAQRAIVYLQSDHVSVNSLGELQSSALFADIAIAKVHESQKFLVKIEKHLVKSDEG